MSSIEKNFDGNTEKLKEQLVELAESLAMHAPGINSWDKHPQHELFVKSLNPNTNPNHGFPKQIQFKDENNNEQVLEFSRIPETWEDSKFIEDQNTDESTNGLAYILNRFDKLETTEIEKIVKIIKETRDALFESLSLEDGVEYTETEIKEKANKYSELTSKPLEIEIKWS